MAEWISDPKAVHEVLALLWVALLIATFPVAMLYLHELAKFFNELKTKEPDIWRRVGSPHMEGMVVMPVPRFQRYFAFYPVLRQRAKKHTPHYRHARSAYVLLNLGICATCLLFILSGIILFWIAWHDL